MTSEYSNRADRGAHVGIQVGNVQGNVNQYNGPVQHSADDDLRKLLMDHIAELRQAIIAAQQREELSASASEAAQRELDTAVTEVPAAVHGDSKRRAI
jgi:hypothetical protein